MSSYISLILAIPIYGIIDYAHNTAEVSMFMHILKVLKLFSVEPSISKTLSS